MKYLTITFILLISLGSTSQVLVSSELLGSATAAELVIAPGLPVPPYGIDYYKLVYNTVDAVGDSTIASGMLALPTSPDCFGFPITVYMHGTTLSKENVPSRDNFEAGVVKYMAGLGHYACAPDYIGMGDSPGLHPYVHAQSEATAGVDMMRASRELIASLQLVDNGQVFISGYSQGGHAGMALHKYIEDNELLEEFDVHVSGLGSGPYNLSGTQTDLILSDEPYSNPGYLVYVLASYDLAYDNLYDTYSDILQSPYDGIVVPFFSGTNTTLNMTSLNAQLPSTVAELIQPDVLSALETDLMHPLRLDLMDNDNYDWAPVRPINMYYCTQDEQVFFSNSLDADSAMAANGSTAAAAIFSGDTDHGGCFFPSMVSAITSFEEVKEGCVTSLREVAFKVGIGPNPVQTVLNISSVEPISRIELFNVRGQRLVDDTFLRVQSAMTFDVRDLPKGQYQIRLTAQNGKVVTKSLIKE